MPGKNPFTPEFGSIPLVMAGREALRQEYLEAFEQGRGNPNLSSILVGPRGSGKTALLSSLAEEARGAGWIPVGTAAMAGMLEDIYQQTRLVLEQFPEDRAKSHVARMTGVTLGPVGATWTSASPPDGNWRTRMSRLLDELESRNLGLLITVDEVLPSLDEMVTLAAVYQLFVREGRRVALAMAGLPHNIASLLNDRSVSFLRRAQQHTLGTIADADVRSAFRRTAQIAGKEIADDALEACTDAIGGYPYMLQLVGFRSWQACAASSAITLPEAQQGILDAQEDFRQHVLAPTYRELSAHDLRFIHAMLEDVHESRIAAIAERMGVESRYASKYRSRLLATGVIEQPARGVVRFALPGFRSYVEEQEA